MRRRHGNRQAALPDPALVLSGSTRWCDGCVFRYKVSCTEIASYGSGRRLCGDELRAVDVAEGSRVPVRVYRKLTLAVRLRCWEQSQRLARHRLTGSYVELPVAQTGDEWQHMTAAATRGPHLTVCTQSVADL